MLAELIVPKWNGNEQNSIMGDGSPLPSHRAHS